MGRVHDGIDAELQAFLERQSMFFVATAPLAADGHVNLSPKGLDGTFAVLGPRQVAYLDLTGSGIETVAHVRENARITLMFCAFDGPARIVRLFGRGTVATREDPAFGELAARFAALPGARSVVSVELDRVADSCGYGVPRMAFVEQRDRLLRWADSHGDVGLGEYRAERNRESIDGLPATDGTIRSVLLDELLVDTDALSARTGWTIKDEGACKADVCVPLPIDARTADGRVDVRVLAERLGMPLVADEGHGLWALGPETAVTGKALTSAVAPELELPDADGNPFRLSSLRGQKVLLVAWASW